MSALSGIDIALWDMKGTVKGTTDKLSDLSYGLHRKLLTTWPARKLGVPIYQLLGGKVRDKIKVYAWIGGDRPDEVVKHA